MTLYHSASHKEKMHLSRSANVIIRNGCHWANKGRQMIISECLCKKDVKIHLPKYQCLLPFNKQSHFFFLWGIFFWIYNCKLRICSLMVFLDVKFWFQHWTLISCFFLRYTRWRLFLFKVVRKICIRYKYIFLSLAFSKVV